MNSLMDRSRMLARLSAAARGLQGEARDWYSIRNAAGDNDQPAEVAIYAEIGWFGVTAQDFMNELRGITASQINLRVSSPGGDLFDGLAIHNLLRSHAATVTAYVDSLAASIASIIVMGADKVVMQPHSQLMIHDASGGCLGNAADMRDMADLLDKQSDNLAGVYAEKAGGQVRSWRNRMKDETWYTAAEAVDAGLADSIANAKTQPAKGPDEGDDGDGDQDGDGYGNRFDLDVYAFAGLFKYPGRDYAPAPDLGNRANGHRSRSRLELGATASPVHHTATVDTTWDKGPNEKNLDSPMTVATAKDMYGWYDAGQVEDGEIVKAGCKFPHHEVSADGKVGAANLAACRNGLARLSSADIPDSDRDGVKRHLQAHLDDAKGEEDRAGDAPSAKKTEDAASTECPNCGHEVGPDDNYCPNCGQELVEQEEDKGGDKKAEADGADGLTASAGGPDDDDPDAASDGDWAAHVAHLTEPPPSGSDDWLGLVAHLTNESPHSSPRRAARRHRTSLKEA